MVSTLLRFDHILSAEAPPTTVIGSSEHRALAREAAGRSVVLLKNELVDHIAVLPMNQSATIAVVGRLADSINLGDGGSSDVWDLDCHTVLAGLAQAGASVTHDSGEDDRWHGWWHAARHGITPMFPFGFGLSYTTFALADVEAAEADRNITVTGSVQNTGERDGADVVQVSAELPDSEAPARLIGFARVEVAAGATASFEIAIDTKRLEWRDPVAHAWRAATGRHRITVGRFAADPKAHGFELDLEDSQGVETKLR